MYLCLTILASAVAWDLRDGRIPAGLTCFGMLASQAYILAETGSVAACLKALAAGLALLAVLFPLFSIGALGGGDCKLMVILPAFLGFRPTLIAIFIAFAAGACIGTVKLFFSRKLHDRLVNLAFYLREVSITGRLKKYDLPPSGRDGEIAAHQIHFTVPILMGVAAVYGGMMKK